MKVAILGGGFTGMTAAYYLAVKKHEVTLIEKEKVLGGLAIGFKQPNWDWYIERAYHHLLGSENDILNFARDVGFEDIFFKETETASLYENPKSEIRNPKQYLNTKFQNTKRLEHLNLSNSNLFRASNLEFRIYPVDTPQDFLKFPLLSLPEKIRAGMVLAFLKFSPFLNVYEKYTAKEFLRKTQGDHVWEVLWQELFRKKFGKYTENILASFIWARITKRAKKLGYIKGGFQTFINHIEKQLKSLKVSVLTGYEIKTIEKRGNEFVVVCHPEFISGSDSKNQIPKQVRNDNDFKENFDVVISTLPTVIISKITQSILPSDYLKKFSKLKYLHAVVLILETKKKILDKTYWLNVCTPKIPIMIVAQHTNFVDKKYYGGNHLAYVGWYVERDDPLINMNPKEVLGFCLPYIKKLTNYELRITNYFKFVGPFAQPIFDKEFVKNRPQFITPLKNFFIANLDMTYPYDRGTNYAVKLGKDVSDLIK